MSQPPLCGAGAAGAEGSGAGCHGAAVGAAEATAIGPRRRVGRFLVFDRFAVALDRRPARFALARFGALRARAFFFRGAARRADFRLRAAPPFFFRRLDVAMALPYSAGRAPRNSLVVYAADRLLACYGPAGVGHACPVGFLTVQTSAPSAPSTPPAAPPKPTQ